MIMSYACLDGAMSARSRRQRVLSPREVVAYVASAPTPTPMRTGRSWTRGYSCVNCHLPARMAEATLGPVTDKAKRLSEAWVPGGQTMDKILVLQIHPRNVWKCVCAAHIQAGLATAGESRSACKRRCRTTVAFSAATPRRMPGSGVQSRQRRANKRSMP